MGSGKYWRRRRPWRIEVVSVALVVCATSAAAQEADAPSGIAALDAFLATVHTLSADFRQEVWSADQRQIQTDTGTLVLARPNRFRWIFAKPSELTVVGDGEQLWVYEPELAQVTVAPFDDTVAASPAMLLSGDRNVRDGFDVESSGSADGLAWVKLVPKVSGSDFISMRIGFSGAEPHRLELVDGLNNVTRIELSHLAINPDVETSAFEFEPPPGAEVIGGEG